MRIKKIILLFSISSILFGGTMLYAEGPDNNEDMDDENVFTLGEVVVTADRTIVDLATTVTEVAAEDIKERGAQTAADALELIPGVNIQQGGKNAWVYLRGFDQEDIKVLIDGVPAYQTYDKVVDLSLIPVDSIAKITVAKGASSVLYGANTFGGVINIITKKGAKEPSGEFISSFGQNSTQNYIFNYGGSKGVFNYWLTVSHRRSDGFDLSDDFDPNGKFGIGTSTNEDGGIRDLSDYEMNTLSTKVGYEPNSDSRLYVSFDYHANEKGIPGGSSYWSFIKWDQWHLNLVGEKKITDILTSKARLYYVSHQDTIEDVSWDEAHTTSRKWFETSSYDDQTVGAELHNYIDFGPKSYLKIGLNYLKDNHKQEEVLDETSWPVVRFGDPVGLQPEEEYEAETYTFAIEDEIRMVEDKMSFVFGLSYDYYKPKKAYDQTVPDSTNSFNPQGGMVYNISTETSVHASVGKKIRFPRLKELYSDMAGGNPDMKPQETISYEIGADHSFNTDLKGSVAVFKNDIKNLIERVQDPVSGDRYYKNVGESKIEGVEFSMDYNATDRLWMGTSYTYLSTFDETNNRDLLNRPKHKIALDTRYRFPYGVFSSVQASYSTGAYEENEDDMLEQTPGFFLLNARVDKSFGSIMGMKDTTLFIQGDNLTDKDYYEGGDPQAGRSFLAGFNFKF